MPSLKDLCEQVLKEENFSVDSWACPVCGLESTRAHWIADHILGHLRKSEMTSNGKAPNRFDLIEME